MVSAGNEWMKYVAVEEYKSGDNYLSMTLDVKHNWKAKILSRTWTYFKDSFVKDSLVHITLKTFLSTFEATISSCTHIQKSTGFLFSKESTILNTFFFQISIERNVFTSLKFTKLYIYTSMATLPAITLFPCVPRPCLHCLPLQSRAALKPVMSHYRMWFIHMNHARRAAQLPLFSL